MLISICIPCYKRKEYVRETLKSIYEDNDDVLLDDYEVVISDNDPDGELESLTKEFDYDNLHYHKTACEGFLNSYYVLTYAKGEFLKLHNSQVIFRKGALKKMINEINSIRERKPLVFYTNGFLYKNSSVHYDTFDAFNYNLSYWSSWSNGFSIWKEDFDRIINNGLNKLFPHTSLYITQWGKSGFVLNDNHWFDTQRVAGRSGHNKFEAFTIEYPSLIEYCAINGWISSRTQNRILHDIMTQFLPILLFNKYVARVENYDISGYRQNIKKKFPKYAYWVSWACVGIVPFRLVYRKINAMYYDK